MTRVRNLRGRSYGLGAMVLVLMIAVAACAPQAADQSAELAAVADNWENALNAGDIDGIVGLYTEDCTIMPPNAEMANGHAGARASFVGMVDAGLTGEIATIKVAAAGDIGYRYGTYWLQTPDGTEVDRGKYTDTWRKVGGEWKITNDIWNSDLAPFAGTTTLAFTHDVTDADHWLAAWMGENSRRQMFARHGAPNVRVFQSSDHPNQVALVVDVADMAALEAFLNSDEGAAAEAEDGVVVKSIRMYTEVK
jgi:ketosteroid isomerase-like protein